MLDPGGVALELMIIKVFGILISIPISYVIFFNTASLDELNRKVIKEGLEISYIENLENNEYGLTAVEQNRFLELLQNQEDLKNETNIQKLVRERYPMIPISPTITRKV